MTIPDYFNGQRTLLPLTVSFITDAVHEPSYLWRPAHLSASCLTEKYLFASHFSCTSWKSRVLHLFLEEPDDKEVVVHVTVGFNLQLELTEEVIHIDVGTVAPDCGVYQQLIRSSLSRCALLQFVHHVQQLRLICHSTLDYGRQAVGSRSSTLTTAQLRRYWVCLFSVWFCTGVLRLQRLKSPLLRTRSSQTCSF